MICEDEELSGLDRVLSDVYGAASEKTVDEQMPTLRAEQRGWIKGRDECWKRAAKRLCVEESYRSRIAELQARYRLVPANGPVRFICEGALPSEVLVTFFRTDPATLIARRGDSVSLMYVQRSASGARYEGRNESFWEHQGEASIRWGYDAPTVICRKAP